MQIKILRFFSPSVLFLMLSMTPVLLKSSPVDSATAYQVAAAQIERAAKAKGVSVKNFYLVTENGQACFYNATLKPAGYLIVSADDQLPPVIAYSFQDDLDAAGSFLAFLKADLALRIKNLALADPASSGQRNPQWDMMLSGAYRHKALTQQWPPEGSTTTGGWLETNWTQNAPYNQMCPLDSVTNARSYVGCPATAMGQILNFHRTLNGTHFNDGDDYYHNYDGRNFNIDDDFSEFDFPSFPQLNEYLDTLTAHYLQGVAPTNQDKAALSFACGVAATQVYTSAGSGTFGVSQAMDAYLRFGCNTATLLLVEDTLLYKHLAQNMKDTLPAHLAIVDAAWSSGHNVVVDGYNTDNFFHVNFGWGGSSNGWYLLPDQIPYGLTVIEGLIVDIMKDATAAVADAYEIPSFTIFPNPAGSYITVNTGSSDLSAEYSVCLINALGQIVYDAKTCQSQLLIDVKELDCAGTCMVRITDHQRGKMFTQKVVIR